jgi:hypothetical protein
MVRTLPCGKDCGPALIVEAGAARGVLWCINDADAECQVTFLRV